MPTPTEYPTATGEMDDRAYRVQLALLRELNLQSNEGATTAEMLAGLAAASADLITHRVGSEYVSKWFAKQSEIISQLEHKPN